MNKDTKKKLRNYKNGKTPKAIKKIQFTKNKYSPKRFKGKRIRKFSYRQKHNTKKIDKIHKNRLANTQERKRSYKGGSRIRITRRNRSHGTYRMMVAEIGSLYPTKKKKQLVGGADTEDVTGVKREKLHRNKSLCNPKNLDKRPLKQQLRKALVSFLGEPTRLDRIGQGKIAKVIKKNKNTIDNFNEWAYYVEYCNCHRKLMKEVIKHISNMIAVLVKKQADQCVSISEMGNTPYFNILIDNASHFRDTYNMDKIKDKDLFTEFDIYSQSKKTRISAADKIVPGNNKTYTVNAKSLIKYMDYLKKAFAVALELHFMYKMAIKIMNAPRGRVKEHSGNLGSDTEVEMIEIDTSDLADDTNDVPDEIQEQDIDELMKNSETELEEEMKKFGDDMLNMGDTSYNNVTDMFQKFYAKLNKKTQEMNKDYTEKTFTPNKKLWSAASLKKTYQLFEQVCNEGTTDFAEYNHQLIGKRYINPNIGYSMVMMKHPDMIEDYYLPKNLNKRKSMLTGMKFWDKEARDDGVLIRENKKILMNNIRHYQNNLSNYQGDSKLTKARDFIMSTSRKTIYDFDVLWEQIFVEKMDNRIYKKWQHVMLGNRNSVNYVTENTLKELFNIVSGRPLNPKSGGSMVIPGLLLYFKNTVTHNMPIHRDKYIDSSFVHHNRYEIPTIMSYYKPIVPFNIKAPDYNGPLNQFINENEQSSINCNKYSMQSDVNNIYNRFKRLPNILRYADNKYMNNNNNNFSYNNDLHILLRQSEAIYPTRLEYVDEHNDTRDPNPARNYIFYRGYLMDRQYLVYLPAQEKVKNKSVIGIGAEDDIARDFDNFGLINNSSDIYHWAGKPKYTDGIIEYGHYIKDMIGRKNSRPDFGQFNEPFDVSFYLLTNNTNKKFKMSTVNQIVNENIATEINLYKKDGENSMLYSSDYTISKMREHFHKNIFDNSIMRRLDFQYPKNDQFETKNVWVKTHTKENLYLTASQMERSMYTETSPNILYFIIVNCLHFTKYFQNVYDQNITNVIDFNQHFYFQPREITHNDKKYKNYFLNFFEIDESGVNGEIFKDKLFKALEYDNYGFTEMRHLTRVKKHKLFNKLRNTEKSKTGLPSRYGEHSFDYSLKQNFETGMEWNEYQNAHPEVYQKYLSSQYNNNNSIIFLTTPFFCKTSEISRDTNNGLTEYSGKSGIGLESSSEPSRNYNMPFKIYQIPYYRQERDARFMMLLDNHRHNYSDNNLRVQLKTNETGNVVDFIPNFWYRIESYLEHVNQSLTDLSLWLPIRTKIRSRDLSEVDTFFNPQFTDRVTKSGTNEDINFYVPPGFYNKNNTFSIYHHDLEDRLMLYKSPIELFNYRPSNLGMYNSYNYSKPRYINPYNMMKYPHYFCMFTSNRFKFPNVAAGFNPPGVPVALPGIPAINDNAYDNNDYLYDRTNGRLSMMAVISKPSILVEIMFLYILQNMNINLMQELIEFYEKDENKFGENITGSDFFLNEYLTMLYYIFLPAILIGPEAVDTRGKQSKTVALGPLTSSYYDGGIHNDGIIPDNDNLTDKYYRPIFRDTIDNIYDYLNDSPSGNIAIGILASYTNKYNPTLFERFRKYPHKIRKNLGGRCTFNIPFLPSVQAVNPMIVEGFKPVGNNQLGPGFFKDVFSKDDARAQEVYDHAIHNLPEFFEIGLNNPNNTDPPLKIIRHRLGIVVNNNHKALMDGFCNDVRSDKLNYKLILLEDCLKNNIIPLTEIPQYNPNTEIWKIDNHPDLLPPQVREMYPKNPYVNLNSFSRKDGTLFEPPNNNLYHVDMNPFADVQYKPLTDVVTDMSRVYSDDNIESDRTYPVADPNNTKSLLISGKLPTDERPTDPAQIKYELDLERFKWRQRFMDGLKDIIRNEGQSLMTDGNLYDLFIIRSSIDENNKQSANIKLKCSLRAQKFIERYLTLYETVEMTGDDRRGNNALTVNISNELNNENDIYHRMTRPYMKYEGSNEGTHLHVMNLYNSEPIYPQSYPDVTRYFPVGNGPFYNDKLKVNDSDNKSPYTNNYIPDDTLPKEKYIRMEKLFKQPIQIGEATSKILEQNKFVKPEATSRVQDELEMSKYKWKHHVSRDHYNIMTKDKNVKYYIPMGRQADFDFPWQYACDFNNKMSNINDGYLPLAQTLDIVNNQYRNVVPKEVRHNWAMNYRHKPVYVMNGLFLPDTLKIDKHTELSYLFNPNFGKFTVKLNKSRLDDETNTPALLTHYSNVIPTDPPADASLKKGTNNETPDGYMIFEQTNDHKIREGKDTNSEYIKSHQYFQDLEADVNNSSFRHLGFLPSGLHPQQARQIASRLQSNTNIARIEIEVGQKVINNILSVLEFHLDHLRIISRTMRNVSNGVTRRGEIKSKVDQQLTQKAINSSFDGDGKVAFKVDERHNDNLSQDKTAQKLFKLTEDIMLYFISDSKRRHIGGYAEVFQTLYGLTQALIMNIKRVAKSYNFEVTEKQSYGVHEVEKATLNYYSYVTYNPTLIKEFTTLEKVEDGFHFNDLYVDLMRVFNKPEDKGKEYKPEDLKDAGKFKELFINKIGFNQINSKYIELIKQTEYRTDNYNEIIQSTLELLKMEKEGINMYRGLPIEDL